MGTYSGNATFFYHASDHVVQALFDNINIKF